MNKYINVSLDVSILGDAHRYKQKAGIFRYTTNLASGLVDAKSCNISLCSGQSLELLSWTKRYLETDLKLNSCPFVLHPHLENNIDQTLSYIRLIERWFKFLHKRGIRKTKKIQEKLINLKSPRQGLIGISKIVNMEIYHSPYYSIPTELKTSKLKKFITIHDLTPLIHPHFFIPSVREAFAKIVSTICKETWIICVSESTKKDLLTYRPDLDSKKISVTHLAADEHFHPHASNDDIQAVKLKYGIPVDAPYVLSLCGGIVLTNNAAPMNELVTSVEGFLFDCQITGKNCLSPLVEFTVHSFEDQVNQAIHERQEEQRLRSIRSRQSYEARHHHFKMTFKSRILQYLS